jgi:hypothetical protein
MSTLKINELIQAYRDETELGGNFQRLGDILELLNQTKEGSQLFEEEIILTAQQMAGNQQNEFNFVKENETIRVIGLQYRVIPGTLPLTGTLDVCTKDEKLDNVEIATISQLLGLTEEPASAPVDSFVAGNFGKIKLEANLSHKVGRYVTVTHTSPDAQNTGTFEVEDACDCDGLTTITVRAELVEVINEGYTLEFDGYIPNETFHVNSPEVEAFAYRPAPGKGVLIKSNNIAGGSAGTHLIIKVKYHKYTWHPVIAQDEEVVN